MSSLIENTVGLLPLFCLILMAGCRDLGCSNEAAAEHVSPDGQWKYVTFDRNCGPTTGSNFQISVLATSEGLPTGAANAFIADDDHGATSLVAQTEWVSDHRLKVVYSPKARVFRKESKVGPIEIEYMEKPLVAPIQ